MKRKQSGDVEAFRTNWKERQESNRYHFKRGKPENQLQLAFKNHWRVFRQVLGSIQSGRVLEVGCGRGSMSAFFADTGFEVHLLDTSHVVLKIAEMNFIKDGLEGRYVCGDALSLPYFAETFDVVLSIGLLEHFAEIEQPLYEQIRILKPGGIFLGYIVPERLVSVQTLAIPVNVILRLGYVVYCAMKDRNNAQSNPTKTPLYRNSYTAQTYLSILNRLGVEKNGSFGMFPVPLISHSPIFPFSLMSPAFERTLVRFWQWLLRPRPGRQWRDPWTCPERWGLAFLVWAKKGGGNEAKPV